MKRRPMEDKIIIMSPYGEEIEIQGRSKVNNILVKFFRSSGINEERIFIYEKQEEILSPEDRKKYLVHEDDERKLVATKIIMNRRYLVDGLEPGSKGEEVKVDRGVQEWNERTARCTFALTGTEMRNQWWFRCHTCENYGGVEENHLGCCERCAIKCHKGHKLAKVGVRESYCDCGAERLKTRCQMMKELKKENNPPPPPPQQVQEQHQDSERFHDSSSESESELSEDEDKQQQLQTNQKLKMSKKTTPRKKEVYEDEDEDEEEEVMNQRKKIQENIDMFPDLNTGEIINLSEISPPLPPPPQEQVRKKKSSLSSTTTTSERKRRKKKKSHPRRRGRRRKKPPKTTKKPTRPVPQMQSDRHGQTKQGRPGRSTTRIPPPPQRRMVDEEEKERKDEEAEEKEMEEEAKKKKEDERRKKRKYKGEIRKCDEKIMMELEDINKHQNLIIKIQKRIIKKRKNVEDLKGRKSDFQDLITGLKRKREKNIETHDDKKRRKVL